MEQSGHDADKITSLTDLEEVFDVLGIDTNILKFNTETKDNKSFEQQPAYALWHLLYSYESDDSVSGNETLYRLLNEKYKFEEPYAKVLANINFKSDYGSLSAKAIKKILPFLKEGKKYNEACDAAGYNHSHSLTKEENDNSVDTSSIMIVFVTVVGSLFEFTSLTMKSYLYSPEHSPYHKVNSHLDLLL